MSGSANASGVPPTVPNSPPSRLAPAASSRLAKSTCPVIAAMCNGVHPSCVASDAGAPSVNSRSITACCSAVPRTGGSATSPVASLQASVRPLHALHSGTPRNCPCAPEDIRGQSRTNELLFESFPWVAPLCAAFVRTSDAAITRNPPSAVHVLHQHFHKTGCFDSRIRNARDIHHPTLTASVSAAGSEKAPNLVQCFHSGWERVTFEYASSRRHRCGT